MGLGFRVWGLVEQPWLICGEPPSLDGFRVSWGMNTITKHVVPSAVAVCFFGEGGNISHYWGLSVGEGHKYVMIIYSRHLNKQSIYWYTRPSEKRLAGNEGRGSGTIMGGYIAQL